MLAVTFVLYVLSLVSCGDTDLANAVTGKWRGTMEYTDEGAKIKQVVSYDFIKSEDVVDGGKFVEKVRETMTFEDIGLIMTCTATSTISGEWEILVGDLNLTYDLSTLEVNIEDVDGHLADDADDVAYEAFLEAQASGMFDESKEAYDMVYDESRRQYQTSNDEGSSYSDVKIDGNTMTFYTGDVGKVIFHRITD